MKRIDKSRAMPVLLAFMIVLSAVFYVGLRPTTAWFHNEYSVENTYDVGTLALDFDSYVHRDMNLTFDATTKLSEALADNADRNREFEYAVKYLYVTVTNTMEEGRSGSVDYLDSLVKIKFDAQALADGLRYYYFACTDAADPVDGSHPYYEFASADANGLTAGGDFSSKIKTFCQSKSIATDADFLNASKNSQMYVTTNTADFSAGAIRVPRNKQVTICIALWVDHGDLAESSTAVSQTNSINRTFSTQLTLYAQQTKAV